MWLDMDGKHMEIGHAYIDKNLYLVSSLTSSKTVLFVIWWLIMKS